MNQYERIYEVLREAMGAKEHGAGVSLDTYAKSDKRTFGNAGLARKAGAKASDLRQKRLDRVKKGRPIKQAVAQRTDGGEEVVDVYGREPGISPKGKKKKSKLRELELE